MVQECPTSRVVAAHQRRMHESWRRRWRGQATRELIGVAGGSPLQMAIAFWHGNEAAAGQLINHDMNVRCLPMSLSIVFIDSVQVDDAAGPLPLAINVVAAADHVVMLLATHRLSTRVVLAFNLVQDHLFGCTRPWLHPLSHLSPNIASLFVAELVAPLLVHHAHDGLGDLTLDLIEIRSLEATPWVP